MKQEEIESAWDEIYEDYHRDEYPVFGGPFTEAMTFAEWLKMYYLPPTRQDTPYKEFS